MKTSENHVTNKSMAERVLEKYTFDFLEGHSAEEIVGKKFVILDDNITSSGTTNALARFITDNGGTVVGFFALTKGQDHVNSVGVTNEQINHLVELAGGEYDEQFVREEARWVSRKGYD